MLSCWRRSLLSGMQKLTVSEVCNTARSLSSARSAKRLPATRAAQASTVKPLIHNRDRAADPVLCLAQLLSDGMQTLAAAGLERNEMLVLVQRP